MLSGVRASARNTYFRFFVSFSGSIVYKKVHLNYLLYANMQLKLASQEDNASGRKVMKAGGAVQPWSNKNRIHGSTNFAYCAVQVPSFTGKYFVYYTGAWQRS